MSKMRAAVKYTALGAVVTAYAGGLVKAIKQDKKDSLPVSPEQVAIAGGTMPVLTLIAGLL